MEITQNSELQRPDLQDF